MQNEGLNGGFLARVYTYIYFSSIYIVYSYIYSIYCILYIIVSFSYCSCIIYYIVVIVIVIYSLFSRAFLCMQNSIQGTRLPFILRFAAYQMRYLRIYDRFTRIYTARGVYYGQSSPFHPRYPAPPYSRQPPTTCLLSNFFYFLFFSWVPYVLVYDVDDST